MNIGVSVARFATLRAWGAGSLVLALTIGMAVA